jgi:single-strand DNA-binding protein
MDNSSTLIIGNLTRDPEFSTTANGSGRATFGVASERRWMKNGEWQSETSFFNVIAWGDKAEMARNLLEKGMQVFVAGSLKQRNYDDKEGNNRSVVEVTANNLAIGLWSLESVERRKAGTSQTQTRSPAPAQEEAPF